MTAWHETEQGRKLANGYQSLAACWNTNLPNHKQSLWNLANRPIKG